MIREKRKFAAIFGNSDALHHPRNSLYNSAMSDTPPLHIITFPHPTLRRVSKPIKRVDATLKDLIRQMFTLMYGQKGVGLAANQVDLPLRLFIMNLEGKEGAGEEFVFLNPVISRHKGSAEAEEGCLSIPGVYGDVIRPKQVRIQGYGIDGKEINVDLTGLAARCVQHEVDHLDGVLFFDRMSESGRGDLLDELYEFETDFQSKRATGEIGSDEVIAARSIEFEKRYG